MGIVTAGFDQMGQALEGDLLDHAVDRVRDIADALDKWVPKETAYGVANYNLSGTAPDHATIPDPVVAAKVRALRKSDKRRRNRNKPPTPGASPARERKPKTAKQLAVLEDIRQRQTEAQRKVYVPIARRNLAGAAARARTLLESGHTRLVWANGAPYLRITNYVGRSAGWYEKLLREIGA